MEFVRKSSCGSRSIGCRWEGMIPLGSEDPHDGLIDTESRKERVRSHEEKGRVCNSLSNDMRYNEMRCKLRCESIYPGVSQICTPRRAIHLHYPCISVHPWSLIPSPSFLYLCTPTVPQSVSIIHVSPDARRCSILCQAEQQWWWWVTDFPVTVAWVRCCPASRPACTWFTKMPASACINLCLVDG